MGKGLKSSGYYDEFMTEKYLLDIVINREKLSDGRPVFVSHCPSLGLASQGKDVEEAMNNIREAVQLYLEEQPEKYAGSLILPECS